MLKSYGIKKFMVITNSLIITNPEPPVK